jgi:predicted PurR-regulated permease PerM
MRDEQETNQFARSSLQTPKLFAYLSITSLLILLSLMLVWPFLPAITWAAALAIAAYPVHKAIESRIDRPGVAAALSVLIVACLIVVPTVLISQYAVDELLAGASRVNAWVAQTKQDAGGGSTDPRLAWVIEFAGSYIDVKSSVLRLSEAIGSHVPAVLSGSTFFVVQVLISFFVLYFLLRDRKELLRKIKSLLPLSKSETDRLFHRIHETVYATIYGTFGVSLIQGFLGGLIFWWLGLPAPALWGAVMFILSLVPVLGAPVVWAPAAIFLAATGEVGRALILVAWGLIVIGSIDNILYPILVGDRVRMHTLVVFISAVGGIALFGASGLVLGPVIVVSADALIEGWKERMTVDAATPTSGLSG